MQALRLNVLGPVQAFIGDDEIATFRTNKVQALLIYLTLEPDPHRREALMELMWPGMPERSARLNLRQILFQLRSIVSDLPAVDGAQEGTVPFVVANRQTIRRNPAASVIVDSERFDELIDSTINHVHPDLLICHLCRERLEEAVGLYRNNLLADFYLDDSNEFEHWAQVKRELYARRALDALEILATIHTREQSFNKARALIERQLHIDDLREGAYRQLMQVLALAGYREEALGVYEKCRRILAEELGMEPSRRTTELYEQIMAGELSLDAPVSRGVRGYELREEIGRGSFGAIHRAVQPAIEREVAVKVIRRRYANDPEFIRRFEAEAQTVAHLEHPHIVPLYDYWRDPDGAYLVMRYLKGGSLLSALESGPWNPEPALKMLEQVCAALSAAHQRGIVHRDIKPANILLDEAGNAFLADFGFAKGLDGQEQMTAAGAVIGTPDYISPEQIRSEGVSAQTDIYSLGAVLYETLTGEKPFPDSSVANLIYKHLNDPVPLVATSRSDVPPQLDDVIQRATAKQPADRYAKALDMADAFRGAIQGLDGAIAVVTPEAIPAGEVYNPYKGLRAFQEADSDDFFGREALVDQLVRRLTDSRFLAVVGPSGSGKSSAVKAGLIPALRGGAILPQTNVAGSKKWFVAEMVPGTHPLDELELALWPVAVDPPPSLVEPMERDTRGMLRTIRRILPDEEGAQLLLVIDQFEELFTLVEDEERRTFFIDSLLQAIAAPRSPLRVVVTLRADFYDRPLQIDALGALLRDQTVVVLPLSTDELTWAIREPARRMGIGLEPGLIEAIIADVGEQPGALPLLQYALTELFDRRQNRTMTRPAYQEMGGIRGTLGRRADAIYAEMNLAGQEATRQLFMRLVTLGEGVEDTRRRVLRSELEAIGQQLTIKNSQFPINYSSVIDAFGDARLLTFDRDPISRRSTVEVAHEALLREWKRLRSWLDDGRADIRYQRQLDQATKAWMEADRESSYLLRGSRLDQFAGWAAEGAVTLTGDERAFLETSLSTRQARQEAEEARQRRELETARKLAETEQARAEEEARSAGRFRRLATILAGVVVVTVVLAVAAIVLAGQASQNAREAQANADLAVDQSNLAATREAEALAQSDQRATAQAEAERQREFAEGQAEIALEARQQAEVEAELRATAQAVAENEAQVAFSRELAAAALGSLDDDPERGILLALEAMAITKTVAAENALHGSILSSRIRERWDIPGPGRAYYLDLSPDGTRLFSSGENGGLLWDVEAGRVLNEQGIDGWINQSQFTPDGRYLLTADEAFDTPEEGTVSVLDARSGQEIFSFAAHESGVRFLILSPDSSQLATGSGKGIVRLWDWPATLDAEEGQLLQTLPVERGSIWALDFSPDGSMIAVASNDGTTMVWNSESGQLLHELFNDPRILTSVIFSPDGRYLLVSGLGGVLDIWDLESGQLASSAIVHTSHTQEVDFGPSGDVVATVGNDGKAKLWRYSPSGLQEIMTLSGHNDRLRAAEFSRDGSQLITSSADGTIRRWNLAPQSEGEVLELHAENPFFANTDINHDWTRLAAGSEDGTVAIWDLNSSRQLLALAGHTERVNRVDFSPDGSMVATASEDRTARVWDVETGAELLVLSGHGEGNVGNVSFGLLDVTFSPDGTRLATAGADGTARIWDLETGAEVLSIMGHPEGYGVTRVSFSPDGSLLVTGTDDAQDDGLAKIWDAETGQELATLGEGRIRIWSVTFSPDGDRVGVADRSGRVDVWRLPEDVGDLADGQGHVENLFSVPAHSSFNAKLLFTADAEEIVTAGSDGKISFRDAWTGEPLLTIDQPVGFTNTSLSPDGDWLAVVGDDKVYRFVLDQDLLIEMARSRVTRSLMAAECQQYLHMAECPNASNE